LEVIPLFHIGDKVFCPLHGAGIIKEIKEICVSDDPRPYYVINLPITGLSVMYPVGQTESGLRHIISEKEARSIIDSFAVEEPDDEKNWSKRYRDNMNRLKSGNVYETARVMKCLIVRNHRKGLSAGERKMLQSAKQILISELMLSLDMNRPEIELKISKVMD